HTHGYLGRDGSTPVEFTAAGREEVRSYGGELIPGYAERVCGDEESGFRVELTGGHTVVARRVLAATGLVDALPDIAGLPEHWGVEVVHCPFCHGFEVRDQRVVAVVDHAAALRAVSLWHILTERLTVVAHPHAEVDETQLDALRAAGVHIHGGTVRGVVTGSDGKLTAVELDSAERVDADALAISPRCRPRAEPFTPLGLLPIAHQSGLGEVLPTDQSGATSVPGVYAAGNVTDPTQQIA